MESTLRVMTNRFMKRRAHVRCLLSLLLVALMVSTLSVGIYFAGVFVIALAICVCCLILGQTKIDMFGFVALCLLALADAVSSIVVNGNLVYGYPALFLYPLIYFAMSYLKRDDLRRCTSLVILVGALLSAVALVLLTMQAFYGNPGRASAVLTNPNAFGIFLGIAWLAVASRHMDEKFNVQERLRSEEGEASWLWPRRVLEKVVPCLEPLLLAGMLAALSLGCILAVAIGGIILLYQCKRASDWKTCGAFAAALLGRVVIGAALGILFYIAATRTEMPWLCIVLCAFMVLICAWWPYLLRFFADHHVFAWIVSVGGLLVSAVGVVFLRSSAQATFLERIDMMANGVSHLLDSPLIGLGPYRWRGINLMNDDVYFNTWQIHNVPLHIGVELGLFAMLVLLFLVVYRFWKGGRNTSAFGAFVVHNLLDTGFFYAGITSAVLLLSATPGKNVFALQKFEARVISILFTLLFIYCIISLYIFLLYI